LIKTKLNIAQEYLHTKYKSIYTQSTGVLTHRVQEDLHTKYRSTYIQSTGVLTYKVQEY